MELSQLFMLSQAATKCICWKKVGALILYIIALDHNFGYLIQESILYFLLFWCLFPTRYLQRWEWLLCCSKFSILYLLLGIQLFLYRYRYIQRRPNISIQQDSVFYLLLDSHWLSNILHNGRWNIIFGHRFTIQWWMANHCSSCSSGWSKQWFKWIN